MQAPTINVGPEADAARREPRATSGATRPSQLPGDGRDQGGLKAR